MLKFVDKILYIDKGETIYYGKPFETASFLNKCLKTEALDNSNPICLILRIEENLSPLGGGGGPTP